MPDEFNTWEIKYAKLVQLRAICEDPSAALYVIAYLTAEFSPERLDAALTAAQEWHEANPPLAPIASIYDERD